VYAAQEFTMGNRQMTRGEKRATAALHYARGADGIYLFNYFVAWDGGIDPDAEVLGELIDPSLLALKDKQYSLAPAWFPVPGVSLTSQLPLALRNAQLETVLLDVQETVTPRQLVLRIECKEDMDPDELKVMFNGRELPEGHRPASPQIFPEKVVRQLPDVKKTVEFAVDPAWLVATNRIGIHAQKEMTVEYVYLGVVH
jgi:hypothetical protein